MVAINRQLILALLAPYVRAVTEMLFRYASVVTTLTICSGKAITSELTQGIFCMVKRLVTSSYWSCISCLSLGSWIPSVMGNCDVHGYLMDILWQAAQEQCTLKLRPPHKAHSSPIILLFALIVYRCA